MILEKHELSIRKDKENRTLEAELFAEILSRIDKKVMEEQNSPPIVSSYTASSQSINLEKLFFFFLSKLYLILLSMVLGALLTGYYATYGISHIYTATSKLYIMGTSGGSIISDLQAGTVLALDYQEVFKTWEVHQIVNEELGTSYSYDALQSMISVSNPKNTRILYITARHSDPYMSVNIANAYASAAKRFIVETMRYDEPSTFSVALVPGTTGGTGVNGYVVRGILFGAVLSSSFLLLSFIFDSRPKSPEDIKYYADIPTLAVIPDNPHLSGIKKDRKKAGKT